ncbi:unnamed protein product [Aspergillus oryzae]|uniref:Unnamed protein product n=1 Tax=Aspergillus oryzae TaxID=5062 RepID=A0AAN5BXC5_ASPOZ|nr:unnamed protein product [Aspergillus oryzae]
MKRPCSRRSELYKESNRASDSITSSSESDDHSDTTVKTDLTEPSSHPPTKNQRRANKSCYTQQIAADDGLGELYNDPLDDTGVDLSGIPRILIRRKAPCRGVSGLKTAGNGIILPLFSVGYTELILLKALCHQSTARAQ